MKSTYSFLLCHLPTFCSPEDVILQAVSRVWKSRAPSKVVAFSWKLILDRIPSKRDIPLLEGGRGCALYEAPSESSLHMFLEFPLVFLVWYDVARWLGGGELVIPLGLS